MKKVSLAINLYQPAHEIIWELVFKPVPVFSSIHSTGPETEPVGQ